MLVILKLPPKGEQAVAAPLAIPSPETRQAVLDTFFAVLKGVDRHFVGEKRGGTFVWRLQDNWLEP